LLSRHGPCSRHQCAGSNWRLPIHNFRANHQSFPELTSLSGRFEILSRQFQTNSFPRTRLDPVVRHASNPALMREGYVQFTAIASRMGHQCRAERADRALWALRGLDGPGVDRVGRQPQPGVALRNRRPLPPRHGPVASGPPRRTPLRSQWSSAVWTGQEMILWEGMRTELTSATGRASTRRTSVGGIAFLGGAVRPGRIMWPRGQGAAW